jgi:hypothetical protein
MKARLLSISLLVLTAACRDANTPTQLAAPPDPSKIISDGAHGGNKDFFFLPPMVPLPLNNPDFEIGKFNNSLRTALKIEICELKAENLNAQGLPTATTGCVAGAPIKTFPTGSVNLVNLPLKQNGWWTVNNLPPDGFYYVLWDTRQSNLNVNKYYRIKVFIDGASEPLGVADVDPMSNIFQWKYTLTGQVIQLVDDVMLPIPFRVENGGGSALCGNASLCVSTTISNSSPSGFQVVTADGGGGAIAGAKFPNGWLPANGPQNVVVTIAQVDIGTTDPVTGTSTKPCHIGLPLQQFPGCFNFTTTPHLAAIDESGRQFAVPVTVAVCYSLQNSGDPREKFAEMYASGPNEPPHALADASDAELLSPATRNCSTTPVIGSNQSRGLTQLASAGWRRIKSSVGSLLGVKRAYAVDLGLGGIATAFSNVGPAITANMVPVGPTEVTRPGGSTFQAYVRLVGSDHHDGQIQSSVGLGNLPVHFAVDNGSVAAIGDQSAGAPQADVLTNNLAIDPQSPVSGGGYAGVNWTPPAVPGVYHLTATGAALGLPIVFTITVTQSLAQLRAQAIDNFAIAYRGTAGFRSTPEGVEYSEGQITYSALLGDEYSFAETFPTRRQIDQRAMSTNNVSLRGVFRDLQRARASLQYAIDQTAVAPAGSPSPIDLQLYLAFANVLAAENYCSGVPTSSLNDAGVMSYGAQQTTAELLANAITLFDQVLAATAEQADITPVRAAAHIGKARARMDQDDDAGAVEETVQVPNEALLQIPADAAVSRQNNGVYEFNNFQRRFTVGSGQGSVGLYLLSYTGNADPRIPTRLNGFGFDSQTPMYMQQKYPSAGAATPLATGLEARLIEAEFYLNQGNLASMTVAINSLRTQLGMSPVAPLSTIAEARQLLFAERAYTLWLTSHRLGDERRLLRRYGRDDAFPSGEYFLGGTYGTAVNFPIPVDATFNPTGMTCFDRNP